MSADLLKMVLEFIDTNDRALTQPERIEFYKNLQNEVNERVSLLDEFTGSDEEPYYPEFMDEPDPEPGDIIYH